MSDPPIPEIDFRNKMAWAWTIIYFLMIFFDGLKSALKFVFNHGLRSKYSKKHPWEFFREIAIANKNRKINTIRLRKTIFNIFLWFLNMKIYKIIKYIL